MTQIIFVTAELRLSDQKCRNDSIQIIEQFCVDMQSEAGCLQAVATYDEQEPQRVVLWERYESRAAIQAHFAMPHTRTFIDSGVAELVQAFETTQQIESK